MIAWNGILLQTIKNLHDIRLKVIMFFLVFRDIKLILSYCKIGTGLYNQLIINYLKLVLLWSNIYILPDSSTKGDICWQNMRSTYIPNVNKQNYPFWVLYVKNCLLKSLDTTSLEPANQIERFRANDYHYQYLARAGFSLILSEHP